MAAEIASSIHDYSASLVHLVVHSGGERREEFGTVLFSSLRLAANTNAPGCPPARFVVLS
jgi:hypothetical protein